MPDVTIIPRVLKTVSWLMIRFKNSTSFVFYLEKKYSVSNPLIEDGKLTEQCGPGHFQSRALFYQSLRDFGLFFWPSQKQHQKFIEPC